MNILKSLFRLLSSTAMTGTPLHKSKSRMLRRRKVYKPFDYPYLIEVAKAHEKMHWTEEEIKLDEDVRDWKTDRMTDAERYQVTEVLKLFTTQDMTVAGFYEDTVIPYLKNNDVLTAVFSFVAREMIHIRAYALLNDTLGLPESDYSAFIHEKALAEKIDFAMRADTSTIEGMALAFVKSVVNEGLSLFGSFVPLLNYQRRGLMKGMGTVVEWSIRDETCLSRDTQVLTSKGWKFVADVEKGDKIAQFDMNTHESSFAEPTHFIRHHHKGKMKHFHRENGGIDMLVTPDHDMVVFNEFNDETYKVKAEDVRKHSHIHFPTSAPLAKTGAGMTDHERFLVAVQADGTIDKRIDGSVSGCHAVTFHFTKQRKKDRIEYLCKKLGYEFTKSNNIGDKIIYRVKVPVENLLVKTFAEWDVDFSTLSIEWVNDFMHEITNWDGNYVEEKGIKTGRIHYGSVIESNTDFVQTIASLSGHRGKKTRTVDNRSPSYKDYFRLSIVPNKTFTRTGAVKISDVDYDDEVFCFTMPKGTLMTRRNGVVGITGNCHANTMTLLFREWCREHPFILTDSFKKRVYDMFREAVKLEDAFIDKIYAMGPVEGLSKEDLKLYIRYLADFRLLNLGFKANWAVEENPIEWLDWILVAPDHSNFFEKTSTEYERNTAVGKIDYSVWNKKAKKAPQELDVLVFGWEGCGYCKKAKELLQERDIPFEWVGLSTQSEKDHFFDSAGLKGESRTAPQIYINGERIGGYTALVKFLNDD